MQKAQIKLGHGYVGNMKRSIYAQMFLPGFSQLMTTKSWKGAFDASQMSNRESLIPAWSCLMGAMM